MHRAFSLYRVLELSKARVECVFELGGLVYVSNSNGDLDSYKIYNNEEEEAADFVMEHVDVYPSFTKKPITKVVSCATQDIFYALSDSQVYVYQISTFKKLFSFGAHCQNMCLYGDELIVISSKKNLEIYEIQKNSKPNLTKTISLNDRPRSLAWVSPTMILVSLSNDFCAVNTETSRISSLNLAWQQSSSLGLGISYIGMSIKSNKLHITRISDDEVLLSKDSQGLLVNLKSLQVSRNPLRWPTVPQAVIYNSPYIITLHNQYIYIWNKETYAMIQQIGISNIYSTFSCHKNTFFTSNSYVWILTPEDFSNQIEALLNTENLNEAISVLSQITVSQFPKRDYYLRITKREKALRSFSSGDYDLAMRLFSEISESPSTVLGLFPGLLDNNYSDAISILSMAPSQNESIESNVLSPGNHSNSQTDLRNGDAVSTVANNKRLRSLSTYLTDSRRKANRFLSYDEEHYFLQKKNLFLNADGTLVAKEKLEKIAVQIDTTLFLIYMISSPALVGSLLRLPNRCETSVVETNLLSAKMYRELVEYYYGKSLHEAALDLLTKLCDEPTDTLSLKGKSNTTSKYEPILSYLEKLSPELDHLIFKYSRVPLSEDPQNSIVIFIDENSEASTISKGVVLKYLETISYKVSIIYLEKLLLDNKFNDTVFPTRLALLYLKRILELEETTDFKNQEVFKQTIKKLEDYLTNSKQYDANAVLQEINSQDEFLSTVSIILYRRLSRHQDALDVYLKILNDWEGALSYCNSVYSIDGETEPYYMLLAEISKNYKSGSLNILDFITKYSSRLDLNRVFPLLPKNISMKSYHSLFSSQFRQLFEELSNKETQSKLYQKRLEDLNEELTKVRSEKVVITREKTCLFCHKRLGKSVISIFPDGSVVHYGCAKKYVSSNHLPYEAY
ncbi:Guanyl-nucleotide exchange factor [Schizosaccharomyces pombe]